MAISIDVPPAQVFGEVKEEFRDYILNKNLGKFAQLSSSLSGEPVDLLKHKIERFASSSQFDDFYQEMSVVLCRLQEKDLASLGSEKPTPATKAFLDCFRKLEQHGFYGSHGHRLNFWSGQEARKKAVQDPGSKSDGEISLISLGFTLCNVVLSKENPTDRKISTFLRQAFSKMFSSQAVGDVIAYVSCDKESDVPALSVGNCFWNNELPTLRNLQETGILNRIYVSFYRNHQGKAEWLPPVLLDEEGDKVVVSRRKPYINDAKVADLEDQDKSVFMPCEMWQDPATYNEWCKTAGPRPGITWSSLKACARCWQEKVFALPAPRHLSDEGRDSGLSEST